MKKPDKISRKGSGQKSSNPLNGLHRRAIKRIVSPKKREKISATKTNIHINTKILIFKYLKNSDRIKNDVNQKAT